MLVAEKQNLYLLGHPLGHSKSADMYNAVYKKMGLNWNYSLADKETKEEAQAFLQEHDFLSINITTPYKPLAFAAAHHKAATAQLAQGANVLVNYQDHLIAYNTDGAGCVSFLEDTGFSFKGKRVVVCGTGPTAFSIVHACAQAGADIVLVLGREVERTKAAVEGYVERYRKLAYATIDLPAAKDSYRSFREAFEKTSFKCGSYTTSTAAISAADIIINATPLGMKENDPAPFNISLINSHQVVFDAVYGHGITALVQGARDVGATVYDGQGMLVGQAIETLQIVFDLAQVECTLSRAELGSLMTTAAGFTCQNLLQS